MAESFALRNVHRLACALLLGTISQYAEGQELPPPLFIEGYAAPLSLAQGDTLKLHTSTPASAFNVEILRWGAALESVWKKEGVTGRQFPVPENASSHGCGWPVGLSVPIPAEWRSGYYVVRFSVTDGGGKWTQRGRRTAEGECYFVLRSSAPGTSSKILVELPTNTYNAYNNWGGFSLYAYHGRGGNQGYRVSFSRPPISLYGNWEQHFVAWAERGGVPLEFAANHDLEFMPELLKNYRLVISLGHDEYWSSPMRDRLEEFLIAGGNAAFFSGNTCCWQVRSERDAESDLALTCWKQNYTQDPQWKTGKFQTLSTLWSHHLVGRPENKLTGVGFLWGGYHRSHGQLMDGSGAFTVHRPEHWVLAGTSLARGAEFGGTSRIVGYECDGCETTKGPDGLPVPTHRDGTPHSFEIVASAPAIWQEDDCEWYEKWEKGRQGSATLGVHRFSGSDGQSRGMVFTAGTIAWSWGLRDKDPAVERITRNVIERLGR